MNEQTQPFVLWTDFCVESNDLADALGYAWQAIKFTEPINRFRAVSFVASVPTGLGVTPPDVFMLSRDDTPAARKWAAQQQFIRAVKQEQAELRAGPKQAIAGLSRMHDMGHQFGQVPKR